MKETEISAVPPIPEFGLPSPLQRLVYSILKTRSNIVSVQQSKIPAL
jgi:hypothetical protein